MNCCAFSLNESSKDSSVDGFPSSLVPALLHFKKRPNCQRRDYVPVEPVVPLAVVVPVALLVPLVDVVPLVPVEPLPDAFPVAVAPLVPVPAPVELVTGPPPPVSVAVVPLVVVEPFWMVSVEPCDSRVLPPHASAAAARSAARER